MGNCQNNKVDEQVISPSQFIGLRLTCKSWLKTYNNLYDYSTKEDIRSITMTIASSTKIIKEKEKYTILEPHQKLPQQGVEGVIDLADSNDGSFVYRSSSTYGKEVQQLIRHLPWLVVRSLPNGKYSIKEGDIVRLGKQKVKVKQIILHDKQQEAEDQSIAAKYTIYNDLTKEASESSHNAQDEQTLCRVCLEDGQKSNPLIAPCKCIGSAKYIHLTCIQQWLTKSINPRTVNKATAITWKPLVCELCSAPLPFKIYIDGKKHFTVKIPRPQKPYLVLNPIYKDLDKAKVYLLVSFAQRNSLMMGRKKDCDIRVSDDASVSRYHTVFSYSEKNGNGKFQIEDNSSKYGTLVFLKKNLQLKTILSGISVQIGGDLIKFQYGFSEQNAVKLSNEEFQQINFSQTNSSEEGEESEDGAQNPANQQQLQAANINQMHAQSSIPQDVLRREMA